MTVESPPARILVVDDDASSRDIAARLLAREGYDTRTAADGPECLTLVTRERVDLILLDVMMPGMDGFAVCAALREAGLTIPVILLTAFGDLPTAIQAIRAGAYDFMTKPVEMEPLALAIRRGWKLPVANHDAAHGAS